MGWLSRFVAIQAVLFAQIFDPREVLAEDPVRFSIVTSEDAYNLVQQVLATFAAGRAGVNASVEVLPHRERMERLLSGEAALIVSSRRPESEDYLRTHRKLNKPLSAVPFAMSAVVFAVPSARTDLTLTTENVRDLLTGKITAWPQLNAVGDGVELAVVGADSDCLAVVRQRLFPMRACSRAIKRDPDRPTVVRSLSTGPDRMGVVHLGPLDGARNVPIRAASALPVVANAQTVADRTYPLAHYVYWYVAGEPSGVARELVMFSLSPLGQVVVDEADAAFLPLPFRD